MSGVENMPEQTREVLSGNLRPYYLGDGETPQNFLDKLSDQIEQMNRAVREPSDFEVMFPLTTDTRPDLEKDMYRNDYDLPDSFVPTVRQLGEDVDPLYEERLYKENDFSPVNPPQQLGEEYNDKLDNDPVETDSPNTRLFRKVLMERYKSPIVNEEEQTTTPAMTREEYYKQQQNPPREKSRQKIVKDYFLRNKQADRDGTGIDYTSLTY